MYVHKGWGQRTEEFDELLWNMTCAEAFLPLSLQGIMGRNVKGGGSGGFRAFFEGAPRKTGKCFHSHNCKMIGQRISFPFQCNKGSNPFYVNTIWFILWRLPGVTAPPSNPSFLLLPPVQIFLLLFHCPCYFPYALPISDNLPNRFPLIERHCVINECPLCFRGPLR